MTYIEELQDAIRHLYHVEAVYVETVPVKEVFQDSMSHIDKKNINKAALALNIPQPFDRSSDMTLQ